MFIIYVEYLIHVDRVCESIVTLSVNDLQSAVICFKWRYQSFFVKLGVTFVQMVYVSFWKETL